jgi:protein KRI1
MQKKKVLLFEEDIEEGEVVSHHKKSKQAESGGFKINEEFARKFEHNKRRELLDKAKEKYGERALLDIPNQEGEGSGSEDEDEDDDGELINATVEKKFLETIAMIRSNDPKLKGLAPE